LFLIRIAQPLPISGHSEDHLMSSRKITSFARMCYRWFSGTILSIGDFLNRIGTPFLAGLASIAGLMWDQGFSSYVGRRFPNWGGLEDLLSNWLPLVTIVATFGAAFCAFLGILTKKSVERLKKELQDEKEKVTIIANNIEAVVDGLLLKLSEKLAFDNGEQSRITIYVHNGRNHFVSFGRYSPNPNFRAKGRSYLPENEGCISSAWRSNWCYEGNLLQEEAKAKYNIGDESLRGRKMNSVFYAVKRINTGATNNALAVLVVESERVNRFDQEKIKKTLDDEEAYFAEIISRLKDHIPDPSQAEKKGF
jgi:hypothetical protein